MARSYIFSDNIISSLGFTTLENVRHIQDNVTGIKLIDDSSLLPVPFFASMVEKQELNSKFEKLANPLEFTNYEKISILSIHDALEKANIDFSKKTLLILSTTKGNIELLDKGNKNIFEKDRVYLWKSAEKINSFFNLNIEPLIVSNACISGVIALNTAHDILNEGEFENIIVSGADMVTPFVTSGFSSFKALSQGPCKPFDSLREGLSLGEGAGTVVLSINKPKSNVNENIYIVNGATSNDANHISGPSRTGDGLWMAIDNTLKGCSPEQINYICAHGTGTLYNDEMEAKAFNMAKLQNIPTNSYKGYFGHTLGAAGIIESIISIHSMKKNLLLKSLGFETMGLDEKINIIDKNLPTSIQTCLKTASGFGGCNAAILFSKEINN